MDTLKFAIVGEIATGKTSVLRRYLYNTFKENYDVTLGVDLASKNIIHVFKQNNYLPLFCLIETNLTIYNAINFSNICYLSQFKESRKDGKK